MIYQATTWMQVPGPDFSTSASRGYGRNFGRRGLLVILLLSDLAALGGAQPRRELAAPMSAVVWACGPVLKLCDAGARVCTSVSSYWDAPGQRGQCFRAPRIGAQLPSVSRTRLREMK